jgi:hypothetical protein
MAFQIAVNGELVEGRSLVEMADEPGTLDQVVERLKVVSLGIDATIDLAALALGRPRAWVANNLTKEETSAVVAALMGEERGG